MARPRHASRLQPPATAEPAVRPQRAQADGPRIGQALSPDLGGSLARIPVHAAPADGPSGSPAPGRVAQSPGIVRRQPARQSAAPVPVVPAIRTSAQLWTDFEAVSATDPARATAIARELIPVLSPQQARTNGVTLLFWLLDHGVWDDSARQLVDRLASAYDLAWAADTLVIPGWTPTFPDPAIISNRAQSEARAGNHGQAAGLFGLAFHLCELILLDLSSQRRADLARMEAGIGGGDERRRAALAQAVTSGLHSPTLTSYSSLSRVLGIVRDIVGFYPREARRAQRAGDPFAARVASGQSLMLRMRLLGTAGPAADDPNAGRVLTMESTAAFNARGQRGYALRGVTGPEEVVTPLPGTPSTDELGLFPDLNSTFRALATAIAGQEEFLGEILEVPEVQRAFPTRTPDMTNVADRLSVWSAMYRAYQRQDTAGLGATYRLMSLIGRYLASYTAHTVYNIRDFGVSYLSSQFPTDLAGRTVQDCGVYALTVAYEVYRTARAARPRLNLDFRLYAQPEHVMLAIFEGDAHYVVSNDQVSPARRGGPNSPELYRSLANVYGRTFNRAFVITPMQSVELGSTRQTDSGFRSQAWSRYQTSTQWGFPIEAPTGPADTRGEGERGSAPYRRYYDEMGTFNTLAGRMQQAIDAAVTATGALAAPAAQRDELGRVVGDIFAASLQAGRIFDRYGPHATTVAASPAAQRILGQREYLFTHAPGRASGAHPLARMAMMLLRFRQVGGTLAANQLAYIDWVRSVPGFAGEVAAYEMAGNPPRF